MSTEEERQGGMKGRGEAADEIYEENLVGGEKRRKKKT